jgi:hypothetical protein
MFTFLAILSLLNYLGNGSIIRGLFRVIGIVFGGLLILAAIGYVVG